MIKLLRHGGAASAKAAVLLLLVLFQYPAVGAIELGFSQCGCDTSGDDAGGVVFWAVDRILQLQKVSDFLIAAAYFSIPLELLYFATCSDLFPFKWIVLQFGAFIVLCGLTHLLAVFTYEPHSFHLVLALTVAKFLTALVSFATAVTLLTLIPQLLRVKVRENFLKIKAIELDREVEILKQQEETEWHVRALTRQIRNSLDRHTILYVTVVQLLNALRLLNCAVWMPSDDNVTAGGHMVLCRQAVDATDVSSPSIPSDHSEFVAVRQAEGALVLPPDSFLGKASTGGAEPPGEVAAIRMPMLKVSDFKGGTPETIKANYAIMVLIRPIGGCEWSRHELELVAAVADQVAVALSHAAVLEESQRMRDKLAEQHTLLLQAQREVVAATEARNAFQVGMSAGMRVHMYAILGLLSMVQNEELGPEQRLVANAIVRTSTVASTLIRDVVEMQAVSHQREHFSLTMRPFDLHTLVKEAVCVVRCLASSNEVEFELSAESILPKWVIGDEKMVFHVLMHMFGAHLRHCGVGRGKVSFRVKSYSKAESKGNQEWIPWKLNSSDGYACIMFETELSALKTGSSSFVVGAVLDDDSSDAPCRQSQDSGAETGLGFAMCKKLVQMMNGNIWFVSESGGRVSNSDSIKLVLQFQLQPLMQIAGTPQNLVLHRVSSMPNFKGMRVLLVEEDGVSRAVTFKLLKKLGCQVTAVSSGVQCLTYLAATGSPMQLVILDLSSRVRVDGLEVALQIRKSRSGCWPLIVALTASAGESVRDSCFRSGINGLVRKPVTLGALADELCRVLQTS